MAMIFWVFEFSILYISLFPSNFNIELFTQILKNTMLKVKYYNVIFKQFLKICQTKCLYTQNYRP